MTEDAQRQLEEMFEKAFADILNGSINEVISAPKLDAVTLCINRLLDDLYAQGGVIVIDYDEPITNRDDLVVLHTVEGNIVTFQIVVRSDLAVETQTHDDSDEDDSDE